MKGIFTVALVVIAFIAPRQLDAAELTSSDAVSSFGSSVGLSGATGIIGAEFDNSDQGSAYLFRNLDTVTGTVIQNAKLIASDGTGSDYFGHAASVFGNTGLVGAYGADVGANTFQGAAYLFRNLDAAAGTVTQTAKLTASDGTATGFFGSSVSLSENAGLVGAQNATVGGNIGQGAIYLFRNIDTATGAVTENAKLLASDGAARDTLGSSVSLSGSIGLVGAEFDDIGSNINIGSAYVFRNLDTVTGTVAENAKLIASDGTIGSTFGCSVSVSGNTGLIGAGRVGGNTGQGAAYLFRNLDTIAGTVTENAKLSVSGGTEGLSFGNSVSLFGTTGLVGAAAGGSVYLFRNLESASGTVTEDVKITASGGNSGDNFGYSVALDGDRFLIGGGGQGKAYTGNISSLTTLDAGNATLTIDGISFQSQVDWIIGQNTDNNQVTLSAGDSADVTADGKAAFIGKNAGSDGNRLVVAGNLTANQVFIGSTDGNTDNSLQLESDSAFTITSIFLASSNSLRISGDYSNINDLFIYLGSTDLEIWDGTAWQSLNSGNVGDFTTDTYDSNTGYTTVEAVPEPSIWILLAAGIGFVLWQRKYRAKVIANQPAPSGERAKMPLMF